MSHDSGFRRGGGDFTHGYQRDRRHQSQASQAYEARLRRRHRDHERDATATETGPATPADAAPEAES